MSMAGPDKKVEDDFTKFDSALKMGGAGAAEAATKFIQDETAVLMQTQHKTREEALALAQKDLVDRTNALVAKGDLPGITFTNSDGDFVVKNNDKVIMDADFKNGTTYDVTPGAQWLNQHQWILRNEGIVNKDGHIDMQNVDKTVKELSDWKKNHPLSRQQQDELNALTQIQDYAKNNNIDPSKASYGDYMASVLKPADVSAEAWKDHTHVVARGENLAKIATEAGISVDELRKLNHIDPKSNDISVGQLLVTSPDALTAMNPDTAVKADATTAPSKEQFTTDDKFQHPGWTHYKNGKGDEYYDLGQGMKVSHSADGTYAVFSNGKEVGRITKENFDQLQTGQLDLKITPNPAIEAMVTEIKQNPAGCLITSYADMSQDITTPEGYVFHTDQNKKTTVTVQDKIWTVTQLDGQSSDGGFTFTLEGSADQFAIDQYGKLVVKHASRRIPPT
jgi:LysM repeat protein